MIVYFKVGNFKSIKEPVVIDFNAAGISEHPNSNIRNEAGTDLLRSILLYGHNASGKSKILDAFDFYRMWIISSVNERVIEDFFPEPFALHSETESGPSLFEAGFILDNVKYRYGFEIDSNKIHNEWLLEAKSINGKEYPVFLRVNGRFEVYESRFENADGLELKTRVNALFLTVASQWNVAKAIEIIKWFRKIQFMHGLRDRQYPRATIEFLQNPQHASLIKELISKADLGINDIILSESEPESRTQIDLFGNSIRSEEYKRQRPKILTSHNKFNEQNDLAGVVQFSLERQESEGTIKYFNIIGRLIYAIQNDSLVIIDEFDARLHTLLSKAIIRLFNTEQSKSKAQLFVASHDTALLDRRLLRRDQIYFVSKNKYGASKVTALVEYKTRKESPYDKNYLEGKYGAIPYIEEFESLLKDAE